MMNKPTRRDFVKTTALAGGGILSAPLSFDQLIHSSVDDELKLAVIGCGGRGTGAVIQALTADSNVRLVAMADAFADQIENSLKNIKEHFDGDKKIEVSKDHQFSGFDGYQKAIDLADVIILTTPPGFRPLHFKLSLIHI